MPESAIAQYWPGDQYVDVVGGTWYIGSATQRDVSLSNMRKYFIHRQNTAKAFALSEVGGCSAGDAGNYAALEDMLRQLQAMAAECFSFDYVTLFLQSKWATDATLAFLPNSQVA